MPLQEEKIIKVLKCLKTASSPAINNYRITTKMFTKMREEINHIISKWNKYTNK